jgi:hypothetical protein
MVATVLSLVPVGLGLFLLAFGVPERPLLAMTPANLAGAAALAVITGPVALGLLGVVGWLAALGLLVGAVLLAAGLRKPVQGPQPQR